MKKNAPLREAYTKDGVKFKLGMTLYTNEGVEKPTSSDFNEVSELEYEGNTYFLIGNKTGGIGTDITHFFSSRNAVTEYRINQLEIQKSAIESEINELRNSLMG